MKTPKPARSGRRCVPTVLAGAAALACAAIVGCQKSNGLMPVTGRVTWKGNPIPIGNVFIEPDASLGNKGPQCRSSIISGVFASRSEFGAVSGPVIVGVEGFEQRPDKEFPVPLFPHYAFKTEIPKGRATLDIVVPENVVTPRR
jgi:hypothetical protein